MCPWHSTTWWRENIDHDARTIRIESIRGDGTTRVLLGQSRVRMSR